MILLKGEHASRPFYFIASSRGRKDDLGHTGGTVPERNNRLYIEEDGYWLPARRLRGHEVHTLSPCLP